MNAHADPTLRALRDLDAAQAALDDDQRARADLLLERVVASHPDAGPTPSAVRSPARRRTPRLVLAGGVVAAAAAVVVAVPLVTGGEEAFAGWSPTPVELTGAERAEAVTACAALQTDTGELAVAPGATPTALVAEARGGWTYVVYRIDGASTARLEGSCLMPGELVADPEPGVGGFFGQLGSAGDSMPPLRQADASREDSSGVGEVDEGVFGYAEGRVGGNVERVVITLASGREVEASVEGGRWAAWWPTGDEGFRSPDVTEAWTRSVTLRDGTVLEDVRG